MMLPYGLDYVISMNRHAERVREAERRQFTRQALKGQKERARLPLVLSWLGRRLVVWGRHLEERSVPRPASQAGSRW